jgi:hypothetical protein
VATIKHRVGGHLGHHIEDGDGLAEGQLLGEGHPPSLLLSFILQWSDFTATVLLFVHDKRIAGIKAEYHKWIITGTASSSGNGKLSEEEECSVAKSQM